jgi:hypothetical protein
VFFFGEISPAKKKGWLKKLLLAVLFWAPWFEFEMQITAPFRHSRDEEDEELSSSSSTSSSSSVWLQLSRARRLYLSAFGFVLLASEIFRFLCERPSLGVTCLYSLSFYTTSKWWARVKREEKQLKWYDRLETGNLGGEEVVFPA